MELAEADVGRQVVDIDANLILVLALTASVLGHIVSGYWNYKILLMLLRTMAPGLRHSRPVGPMPPLGLSQKTTDQLVIDELEGMTR